MYPQVLLNVRVFDKKGVRDDEDVQAAVKRVEERLGDGGRILLRESGTEPVVRVMVECLDEAECFALAQSVVEEIKRKGHER